MENNNDNHLEKIQISKIESCLKNKINNEIQGPLFLFNIILYIQNILCHSRKY